MNNDDILNFLMSGYRIGVNPLALLRYQFSHYEWKHADCESRQGNPRWWDDDDGDVIRFRFDLRLVTARRRESK